MDEESDDGVSSLPDVTLLVDIGSVKVEDNTASKELEQEKEADYHFRGQSFGDPQPMEIPADSITLATTIHHRDSPVVSCASAQSYGTTYMGAFKSMKKKLCHSLHSVGSDILSVAKDVTGYYSAKLSKSVLYSESLVNRYTHLLSIATNYDQYYHAGMMLDALEGRSRWKNDPESNLYDFKLLQEKLTHLRKARESGSLDSMIFTIRSSLDRRIGGLGNPELFRNTHIGTKKLIEEYNDEIVKQLLIIRGNDSQFISVSDKYSLFRDIQRAYGRTALLLSGGAVFGLSHLGVCKALFENKLLPRVISGASVGSIIASVICSRTDSELTELFDPKNVNLDVFERNFEQSRFFSTKLSRLILHGVIFDTFTLSAAMKINLGELTFQEAYNKTRRILNITISSSTNFEMPRLLNYLTAPDVLIYSAVAASCAIPYVYRSSPILQKNRFGAIEPWNPTGQRFIDGSIDGDLPALKISELFNVNHFIVAQVNPHVVKLLDSSTSKSPLRSFSATVFELMHSELKLRIRQLTDLGLNFRFFTALQSLLLQKYTGDITIIPNIIWADYGLLVANPTDEIFYHFLSIGERACWPHISMIKSHCQVEHAIDDILYQIRVEKFAQPRPWLLTSDNRASDSRRDGTPPSGASPTPRSRKISKELDRASSLRELGSSGRKTRGDFAGAMTNIV